MKQKSARACPLTVIGILVGVGAALLTTRALAQLLFGISPLDATSF